MKSRSHWLCAATRVGAMTLLGAVTGCGGTTASRPAPKPTASASAPTTRGTITVTVEGLHNDKGQLIGFLYNDEDAFPTKMDQAVRRTRSTQLTGPKVALTFENVPGGTYAVAVIHDENGDGELERNFIGIPSEGVGASNRATATLGPPSWDDAKFEVAGDAKTTVDIRYP